MLNLDSVLFCCFYYALMITNVLEAAQTANDDDEEQQLHYQMLCVLFNRTKPVPKTLNETTSSVV